MQIQEQNLPCVPLYIKPARAYVSYQTDTEMFVLKDALQNGTLFKYLYSPYENNTTGDDVLC